MKKQFAYLFYLSNILIEIHHLKLFIKVKKLINIFEKLNKYYNKK